ncbi:hypothetical protein P6U16_03930 [Rhizobium sp. 32-5/1]|uniref:hypothetical protein n=1 Tax=Rhizobium sp. 32-5/1 TaxID=3019602 RepID=UPI00240D6FF0|nr:hypothetical protein [Rhizobium sp. 32-5/1]WEZ83911.1 hypothetical protein P6U16_03930 [Rhizobium sp. 32-5/1]
MSSTSPDLYLTSTDLNLLQSVLIKTGYWCDLSPKPRECDVATKLIIRLFQRGIVEPGALSEALVRYMGARIPDLKPYVLPSHRFAIQGVTPELPTLH